eukprot:COSAG01_NODE_291_length_19378_cov_38.136418_5_plen_870_part_00
MCCCAEAPCAAVGPPWPAHTECNSGQTPCNTQCGSKKYQDTCDVTCKSGYTQSAPASSKATYLCAANGRQPTSLWTGSLHCAKVDCHDFPHPYTSPGNPAVDVWENIQCSSNLFHDGKDDTDGHCSAKCIESFYESPDTANPRATREIKDAYCLAPGPSAGLGNPTGVWTPQGKSFLDCQPGSLSAKQSALVDFANDFWLKVSTPQSIYSGKVRQLEEAAKFGPTKGPTYTFDIVAKDVQGNPRNYHNLGRSWDYLVLKIERVPLQMLPEDEQRLQPQQTLNLPTSRNPRATGTWSGGTSRPYRKVITSGLHNNAETVTFTNADGKDGRWRVSHQFEEHGVFYVSVFLCTNTDATTRGACDNAKESNLVPQTGTTGLSTNTIATRAFTICPQNTGDPDRTGAILGSHLGHCKALSKCFSPLGPGRIAGFCPVGFQCENQGTTWPLAEPGHWVSSTYPVQTTQCLTLGACPGSSRLHAECPHAAQAGDLWPVSNFESAKLTIVGADPCFMQPPPADCPLGPCFEHTRKICQSVVGSRCCPGNTGKKSCESCCKASQGPPTFPSCDKRQWHPISTPEGTHCEPCPPVELNFFLVLSVTILLIILAPILVKLAEISKHAGAIQGPLLSVVNFFQSSSLFVGLRGIRWPPAFKTFARSIADVFNFNIVPLLHYLKRLSFGLIDIPPLDCAWTMSYSLKFVLVMLTPFLLAIAIVLVQYAWLCWLALWSNRWRMTRGCCSHFCCCLRKKRKKSSSFMSVQLLQQGGDNIVETSDTARNARVAEIQTEEVKIRQLSKVANNRSTNYIDAVGEAVRSDLRFEAVRKFEAVRNLKSMKAKFEADFGQPYPESLWRVLRDHDTGQTLATVKRCCLGYL